MRFQFRYSGPSGWLVRAMCLGPRFSYLEVTEEILYVRFGWGFRATVPRRSIRSAVPSALRPFSRGVHGWNGRWLVNASGKGLVTIDVDPRARGYALGFPVRLRQLVVSTCAPDELIDALAVV